MTWEGWALIIGIAVLLIGSVILWTRKGAQGSDE